jgi:hypothetical protein
VLLDDRHGADEDVWFTPGEVVAVVPDELTTSYDRHQREVAPPGTRFYGRVYVVPGSPDGKAPGELIAIYDHVEFENGRKFPVCFLVEEPLDQLKDGKGLTSNRQRGFPRGLGE